MGFYWLCEMVVEHGGLGGLEGFVTCRVCWLHICVRRLLNVLVYRLQEGFGGITMWEGLVGICIV